MNIHPIDGVVYLSFHYFFVPYFVLLCDNKRNNKALKSKRNEGVAQYVSCWHQGLARPLQTTTIPVHAPRKVREHPMILTTMEVLEVLILMPSLVVDDTYFFQSIGYRNSCYYTFIFFCLHMMNVRVQRYMILSEHANFCIIIIMQIALKNA